MSTECDHDAIFAAFAKRHEASKDQAIYDAYHDVHADELLAQILDFDSTWWRTLVAGRLSDFTGVAGDAALRRAIATSGPGTIDLRCVALLALARRIGVRAMPELLEALSSPHGALKDCAVMGLAGTGDDRAWEQVFEYLRAVARRRERNARARALAGQPYLRDRRFDDQSEAALAAAYLAQHLSDPKRRSRLIALIRKDWSALDEADWFARLWPDAAPSGPAAEEVAAPNSGPIRAWARQRFFAPIGPPDM